MRRQLQTKNNLWKIGGKKSAVIYRFLMKVNALKNLRAIGKKNPNWIPKIVRHAKDLQ